MEILKRQAEEVVYFIRVGEVAYALVLYLDLLDTLSEHLDEQSLINISELLAEMLRAQENGNFVWLADLIQEFLVPYISE